MPQRASSNIPSNVKIGAADYSVTTDPMVALGGNEGTRAWLYGSTDHVTLRIMVNPATASGQQQDTLLHEALHGVVAVFNLMPDWNREQEETFVSRFTPLLLLLLRDNPELVRFVTR
jgi:hypothetical protein